MYVDAKDEGFREIIAKYPFLGKYTSPMKRMERALVGRQDEMRSLKAAFNRAELSNVLLLAEAGSGKAIDDDEVVAVDDARGYIRMGDVAIGDVVFDQNGKPTKVVGVFPQGEIEAYRVTFADGTSIVCNDEHIWRVCDAESYYRATARWVDATLAELLDAGLVDFRTGAYLWYVPVCDALARSDYDRDVRADSTHYGGAVASTLASSPESAYPLDDDDMSAFLLAPYDVRQGFCQAMMMGLGAEVNERTGVITVKVPDDALAEQLTRLLTSIGTRVHHIKGGIAIFGENRGLGIASVEKLEGKRKMTCIYVDSPEHTFVVGRYHVVTHNTALVQGAMETDEDRVYLEVDLTRMIADIVNVDEISDKLKQLFAEAGSFSKDEDKELVLFMDEFHQVVQISAVAVEALKPLLADSATRGIHVVAATTYAEFVQYISSNQPLVERLQRINLPEVDRETTVAILRGMAKRYGVAGKIGDDGIYGLIYEYTNRYIPANAQPRKSILVLDSMIGWHRSENRRFDLQLLADVIYESEGVNVAFRVDPTTIKERIDEKVYAQDFATSAIAQRLQLCVADLNDKSKTMSNFLFCGSTGVGKGTAGHTVIPVMPTKENGFVCEKLSKDIEVGDIVFSRTGEPERVVGVFPQGKKDVYRVSFTDGRELVVDGSHLWGVYPNRRSREEGLTVYSTETLIKKGLMTNYKGHMRCKYQVPMNGAVQWPEADLDCDPYVVGAFIGNGCLTVNVLTLSSADEYVDAKIAERIGSAGYSTNDTNYNVVFPTGKKFGTMRKLVQASDVLPTELLGCKSVDKRIPARYLHGSVEQRWELVNGLFDTDGHIGQVDGDRFNVSYSTSSEGLARDVVQLMFSLGVGATITCHEREGRGSEYDVHLKMRNDEKHRVFTLPRKHEIALRAKGVNRQREHMFDYVGIKSIEKLPEQDETYCLYVDDDEHLYQAGQFVVTHNTEVVKQMAAILFGDAQRHLHRLDMSEFANADSLERFRLELTTKVWERPYCIILLDEVEKACGEVIRMLLSVLDDARLTDRNGRVVSFNNAYVVMTTNAGSEIFKTIAQYEESDSGSGEFLVRYEKLIRNSLMSSVGGNRFPPELLGRVNCIVPFQPLSENTMRRIVRTKLSELKADLWRKHGVEMAVSERVMDYLVVDSLDTDSDSGGARAVISKLESEVSTEVARFVNSNPGVSRVGVKIEGEMASENKHIALSDALVKVVGIRESRGN